MTNGETWQYKLDSKGNVLSETQVYQVLLKESEIQALQKILGFFLIHTSKDIYSVMEKLDNIIGSDFIDYSDVVFSKTDADGCEIKKYKHSNFNLSFKNGRN